MNIFLGKKGLKETWQDDFSETVKCTKKGCKGTALIAFVAREGVEEKYICDLYKREKGLWVHDSVACAVYFCTKCLEPIAEMNQA